MIYAVFLIILVALFLDYSINIEARHKDFNFGLGISKQ